MTVKGVGGRPMKFKTPEELQKKIDAYFKKTPDDEITITGLAIALDTTRETLIDYGKRDEFSDTIKNAKDRVANEYEKDLRKKGRSGDIFALKNFGWKDKQEQDIKHSGSVDLMGLHDSLKKEHR